MRKKTQADQPETTTKKAPGQQMDDPETHQAEGAEQTEQDTQQDTADTQQEDSTQAQQEDEEQADKQQPKPREGMRPKPKAAATQQADQPAQEEPSTQPQAEDRVAQLEQQLLQANSRNAAYAAGVRPELVEDAVTLAMAQAAAVGEVTQEAVQAAMQEVLQRHPDWKMQPAQAGKKTSGGFVLGADPDRTTAAKSKATEGSKKPWNKFNR